MTAEQMIARALEIKRFVKTEQERLAEHLSGAKNELEAIENQLRATLQRDGVNKVTTDAGTAYFSEVMTPRVADREKFIDWCMDNWDTGGNALLKLGSPQVDAVREYCDTHDGQFPPGVEASFIVNLNIRRSS